MKTEADSLSAPVSAMRPAWDVIEPLVGGTLAMRAAGKRLLPKQPREDEEDYKYRLSVSTLFPAYTRTVSVMAAKPFSTSLTLQEDVPPQIIEWAQDIDREGASLHRFASEMFRESFYGLAGILVEAPKLPDTGGRTMTRAEQAAAGVRPYFVRVMHDQILGWRTGIVGGVRVLTQLRIREAATVPDGDYGEKDVVRVRVLEPGRFRVMEKQAGVSGQESWAEVDSGLTGLPQITFQPVYGQKLGFMRGKPPLEDLAHMNVQHWQDSSDQADGVRYSRKRMVVAIGVTEDSPMIAGSAYIMQLPPGADMKVIQGSADSVTVGRDELNALEQQMVQAGAELLVKKPGQRSATESENDAEGNKSDLQCMAENFEDSLDAALQMMADYANLGSGGHVSLYKDFGAATLSDASAQLLVGMAQAGQISDETLIEEMKRRGVLSPDITAAAEAERIEAQGPALGTIEDPEEVPEGGEA